MMRYISLFSGVEAATLAWEPLGWEPVAFAEIEPFPSAVLAYRWPDVPNLGDITKVDWSKYHGAADIVVGGFPCQSYSVAGLRKGLADPRGNLMLEFLKACREIDPEWVIGENVPGLLSSNGGRDFQTLLEAVAILWPRGGHLLADTGRSIRASGRQSQRRNDCQMGRSGRTAPPPCLSCHQY